MIRALLFVAALLEACAGAPRAVAPTPPAASSELYLCGAVDPEPQFGSCGQKVTAEGYQCATCARDNSCLDAATFTYCVGDRSCADLRCDKPARGRR